MKKIEAIIRPEALQPLQLLLLIYWCLPRPRSFRANGNG